MSTPKKAAATQATTAVRHVSAKTSTPMAAFDKGMGDVKTKMQDVQHGLTLAESSVKKHGQAAPKPEVIRLASGRLAKMKKNEVPSAARYNALVEDLEAIGKRLNAIERGIPAKPKAGLVQKSAS